MADDRCLWWDTAGGSRLSAESGLPERADVAVIGGGYTGISAARTLARNGANVVLLEREILGFGASTRNGGFVLPGYKADIADLVRRHGVERAGVLWSFALESVGFVERVIAEEGIGCDYSRCGHLVLAAKPAHLPALEADARLLRRLFGYETAILGPGDLHQEILTPRYHGALLDAGAGGLHPAKYFHGLAAAALRAGARLIEGAGVTGIRRDAAGFEVTTAKGQVRAGEVLIATNGYTGRLTRPLARRVVPVGSYIIATPPLEAAVSARLLPGGRVCSDTKNLLYYFRLTPDRRLLFGGRASFTPTSVARSAQILGAGLRTVFPDIAAVPLDYAWGGTVGFTRDLMPHAGTLEGIHHALGYGGHGVAMAGYLGHRVGEVLAGRDPWPPLAELGFPVVPLYRGRPWFLPLVGAYYRMKDWIW